MTDDDLKEAISSLRAFTHNKRMSNNDLPGMSIFFLNVIEIACSLTELGIAEKKAISKENEYWFEGGYLMNFWNSEIEEKLYSPIVTEVKK